MRAVRRVRGGRRQPTAASGDASLLEVVALAAALAAADDAVLQLHLGAVRNVVAAAARTASGATPAPTPSTTSARRPGSRGSSATLERDGTLPRTVLYNAQPRRRRPLRDDRRGLLTGRASARSCSGARRGGSTTTRTACAASSTTCREIGQLAGFIGMLTDSRSILSMTRHELFRRVLCDAIGRDVDAGLIPGRPRLCSTSRARHLRRQRRRRGSGSRRAGRSHRRHGRRRLREVDARARRWPQASACRSSRPTTSTRPANVAKMAAGIPLTTPNVGPGSPHFAWQCATPSGRRCHVLGTDAARIATRSARAGDVRFLHLVAAPRRGRRSAHRTGRPLHGRRT